MVFSSVGKTSLVRSSKLRWGVLLGRRRGEGPKIIHIRFSKSALQIFHPTLQPYKPSKPSNLTKSRESNGIPSSVSSHPTLQYCKTERVGRTFSSVSYNDALLRSPIHPSKVSFEGREGFSELWGMDLPLEGIL